jgi:hypothetical protein
MSKYHNRRVSLDGYTFDSAAEARRYQELRLMEAAGELRDIEVHPRFRVEVMGCDGKAHHICDYVSDFRYWDCRGHRFVVEDVKGVRTQAYILKRKLVEALYGWTITEVEA